MEKVLYVIDGNRNMYVFIISLLLLLRISAQSPWQEGELLWGKIKGFPYWPCMVSKDPFSQVFAKQYGELPGVTD